MEKLIMDIKYVSKGIYFVEILICAGSVNEQVMKRKTEME